MRLQGQKAASQGVRVAGRFPHVRGLPLAAALLAVLLLGLLPADRGGIAAIQQGDALAAEGRYGEALRAYQAAAERSPGSPLPHLRQGAVYLAQGRYREAEAADLTAVQLGGLGDEAREALARLHLARGEGQWAAGYARALLARRPASSDLWILLGQALRSGGAATEAQAALERALSLDLGPEQRQAVHLQLAILSLEDDPRRTLDHLQEVEQGADPALAQSVAGLAEALRRLLQEGEYAQQQVTPAFARAKLGEALYRHGDLALARRQLEAAVELEPAYADAHAYLGHVLSLLGERDPATAHLEQAIALEPKHVLARYFLGMHAARQGLWLTAREYLVEAYELEPDNPAICAAVAETYLRAEERMYEAAERWLHAAVSSAPADVRFHLLLAHLYVDDMVDPAGMGLTVAEFAVRLAPENSEAQETLGWAHYLAGAPDLAIGPLQRALELTPAEARVAYRLGEAYRALGRADLARPFYQRALDLDWNGPIGQRARASIQQ